MIEIELKQLGKKFGARWAVEELSLAVPTGEIYGLLGHNGAGKSTAIGMMLGQVWPTCGEVRVCGHDVTVHRARALSQVGAIFESPAFYDYLSGYRNLQILSSYTARVSAARLREVIDWVGLTGREHGKVHTYSHGMRARLALAQALLPNPRLLILDEPSDGLDPEGIHEMRETILRLHRELGLTILLSSHLLNEVEQLCTRIAVLNHGCKIFEGPLNSALSQAAWLRLRVDDFPRASTLLRERGLILKERDEQFISLAPGAASDVIVEVLVQNGLRVYEVTAEEQTLEHFYLQLMERERAQSESNACTPA
jgi:ABC-2 type transport system ATP-binding protein